MSNIVSNLPKVSPASDIIERENAFYIYLDMPGVCKEQLEIEVEGNELYIQAQTCHCIAPEERLHSLEFGDVHYKAVYTLSDQMDVDKIEANLENGALEIVLPKRSKPIGGRIKINVG